MSTTTLLSTKVLSTTAERMSLLSNSNIDKLKALVINRYDSASYVEDVKSLCQDLGDALYHQILPEELELLTKLYQNIYSAKINNDDEAIHAQFTVAKTIIVALGLMDRDQMMHQMPPVLSFSAVTEAVSEARSAEMKQISKNITAILEQNKHPGSYGVVLNVGYSENTKVPCLVFGSQTPKEFQTPRNLTCGATTIGTIVRLDHMSYAGCSKLELSWFKKIVHGYNKESGTLNTAGKIDLSGYSFGRRGNIDEGGTLTCYLADEAGNIFALGAAHTVSEIDVGCEIAVPATLETTARFHEIYPRQRCYRREVPCLDAFSIPLSDQDRLGHENCQPTKILLPRFGTVVAFSHGDVSGVLEIHNTRLNEEDPALGQFTHSPDVATKVEWCCVKMDNPSRASNVTVSSTPGYSSTPLAGLKLLFPGMPVLKIGRTTSSINSRVNANLLQWYSLGTTTEEINVVSTDFGRVLFGNRGDSGALVVSWEDGDDDVPYAVGMLVGLNEEKDINMVTPIQAVLENMEMRMGKKLRLMMDLDVA